MACGERRIDDVRALLAAGVDVNEKCCGAPSIVIACKYGGVAIVDLLLSSGADPGSRSRNGGSLLQVASLSNDADVAQLLVVRGATISAGVGLSEIAHATYYRNQRLVDVLVDAGADPYHRSRTMFLTEHPGEP